MKKIIALLLALTMVLALAACGKKPAETPESPSESGSNQSQTEQGDSSAPEDAETDATKLGEAIAYRVDSEGHIIISVKTSAYIKNGSGWLGICPLGIYLTEESADAADSYYEHFDSSYDKEWFDGVYTFVLNDESIEPGTYTMVLCDDDDSGKVIGEWIFDKRKSGDIEIGFDDSWLKGAGEGRTVKEFDSLEKEVASWFTFNEYSEEWAEFFFDGYYLEEVDPYGYDSYYLFVCPEGDYSTYDEAMEAHVGDYSGIGEKCPYKFSINHYSIEPGKYTMVLARDGRNDIGVGGNVEVQFGVEKTSDTKWKFDFENAKCPALDSKYAGTSGEGSSAAAGNTDSSNDSEVLNACGLTVDDIKTSVGTSLGDALETPTQYIVPVFCADASFTSFESWVNALADNCRKAAKDGNIYESEFKTEPLTAFELDSGAAINIVQFVYKTTGHTVYVTASESGSVENAFSCNIQVY